MVFFTLGKKPIFIYQKWSNKRFLSSDQQFFHASPANVLVVVLTILSVQNCLSFINIPLIWNVHIDLKFSDELNLFQLETESSLFLLLVETTLEKSWQVQGRKEEWNRDV